MDLSIRFENDLKKYGFLGKHKNIVIDFMKKHIATHSIEFTKIDFINNITNLIKTSVVINESYDEFMDNMEVRLCSNSIKKPTDFDDHRSFIIASLIVYLLNTNDKNILNYVKDSRDIIKELFLARNLNGGTEDDLRNRVLNAKTSDSYTVQEPKVKNWDEYYYNVCKRVASNSKCFSRQIGAILVVDKSIVSTGYNGPPRGIPTCDERWLIDEAFVNKYKDKIPKDYDVVGKCPRKVLGFSSGQGLEICIAGHAERNVLINAAREGIKTKGGILYMTCNIPCSPCLIEIINAGISEIVVTSVQCYDENSMFLLSNSNIKIRLFDFIEV